MIVGWASAKTSLHTQKTFKLADKDLKSMWNLIKEKKVQEFFVEKKIIWKYCNVFQK